MDGQPDALKGCSICMCYYACVITDDQVRKLLVSSTLSDHSTYASFLEAFQSPINSRLIVDMKSLLFGGSGF
jgi:hypothetical protein